MPENIAAQTKENEARFATPFIAAERGFISKFTMPYSTRRRVARTIEMQKSKQVPSSAKKPRYSVVR